jgi:predicted amidohydrolase
MKITLAQIDITASISVNLKKILKIIEENPTSHLIIFPELALTSYNFEYIASLNQQDIDNALKKIQLLLSSNDQIIVIGTSRYTHKGLIYNSAAIISSQNILFYDKINLTEKDRKIFSSGNEIYIFNSRNFKVGIIICRDQNDLKLIQQYKDKIDIMLQLSAHYYKTEIALKKLDKNIAMPIVRAIDCNCTWIKVNTVGRCNNEISLGNSIIVSPLGEILRQANKFTEEILTFKDIL